VRVAEVEHRSLSEQNDRSLDFPIEYSLLSSPEALSIMRARIRQLGRVSLAWPSCCGGGQVGSFARGVPVDVDSDGVEVAAVERAGVCRRLVSGPG
jgi:hypothetical protein